MAQPLVLSVGRADREAFSSTVNELRSFSGANGSSVRLRLAHLDANSATEHPTVIGVNVIQRPQQ